MNQHLVLTVIGDDRPGLVGELSAAISKHGGNWLESSMAQLAGKFAGIVEVSVDAAQADALRDALGQLAGLKVTVESATTQKSAPTGRRLKLALIAAESSPTRPGRSSPMTVSTRWCAMFALWRYVQK